MDTLRHEDIGGDGETLLSVGLFEDCRTVFFAAAV
jgi:hypothetical protein